jgi:hypothetical protein
VIRCHPPRRRGNAVMFSLMTSMLLGFGALSVDIGYMRVTQTELSIAADAAAHGGVAYLRRTPGDFVSDMATARTKTVQLAFLNSANDQPVILDPNVSNSLSGDIVLGNYDHETGVFTQSVDPAIVDAVMVKARMAGIGTIFAPAAFGVSSFSTGATAIAVRGKPEGAGRVECTLPIALPYCEFKAADGRDEEHATDDLDGDGIADINEIEFKLQPATGDNLGWSGFSSGFGATDVKARVADQCKGGGVEVGDPVYLKNGDMGVLPDVAAAIAGSSTSWNRTLWGTQPARSSSSLIPARNYGRTLEGPAALFDAGPEYCDADPRTGDWTPPSGARVVGFAWVALYDAIDPKGSGDKTIRARVEVMSDRDIGSDDGGPDFGIEAPGPDLLVY